MTFADDRNGFAALMAAFAGGRVARVDYLMPIGAKWPNGRRDDQVHEVDLGVEIVLDSGSAVSISWAMAGAVEGLSISVRGIGDIACPNTFIQAIDAIGLKPQCAITGTEDQCSARKIRLPPCSNF